MKKTALLCLLFVLGISTLIAQPYSKKTLLTVNGVEISAEEFMTVFMKNSSTKTATKQEIDEYLELYINFRLKVTEAMMLKLDTQQSFIMELAGYRKQLAQPYLTRTEVLDKLVNEAYERMKFDLRASHILIKVSPYASPADTLKAYKKAMAIRKRIINGEPFDLVALEVSEDPSAKGQKNASGQMMQGNKGDLGFFSGMDLMYNFENVAYAMKIGEVSMPVRSENGYHIIKLTDKRKSLGKVQTAHILVAVSPDATQGEKDAALLKANDLYTRVQNGEPFEDIAKEFSDDKGSGMRGGMLPWFGVFRMLPEFIEPLYTMEKGAVTKPILTTYGYHIVKLIDVKPLAPFDEMKNDLKMRIMRDARYQLAINSLVEKLKLENGFQEFPDALQKLIIAVNDSIYDASWKAEWVSNMTAPLFTIGKQSFTQYDFALYIEARQPIAPNDNKGMFINKLFDEFVQEKVIEYENGLLEQKYPQFASLMKEYHDGILLFDLTDQKVWSKALKDTTGLNAFYNTVKMNYLWPERVEGTVYYMADKDKAFGFYKDMKKAMKKGTDLALVFEMYSSPEEKQITEEYGIFIKADHPVFAGINETGITKPVLKDGMYMIVKTDRIIAPEPKALREVKGVVTNEYQNYLEQEWIKELRAKYSWSVNSEVLQTLYRD